jgi:hypothetical protein
MPIDHEKPGDQGQPSEKRQLSEGQERNISPEVPNELQPLLIDLPPDIRPNPMDVPSVNIPFLWGSLIAFHRFTHCSG